MNMPLTFIERGQPLIVTILSTILLFACTGIAAQDQNRGKIDEFGVVNAEDAMARLDRFALELQNHPESRGIIVASRTISHSAPRGTFLRLAHGYLNYLVKSRGVEAERVSVVEGGRKPETRFELWTLPRYELSTISEEAIAPEPPAPQLFDSLAIGPEAQCVGSLPIRLYKLDDGLRILRGVLTHHSRAKVWIVVHPRARDSQVATQRLVSRSRQLLMKDGVKAERILTAIGASRSSTCGEVNLWIVPANSAKADEAGYYSQLMSDAESAKYTLRRVEFSGNQYVADGVLRKQLVHQEGDLFSRKLLDESLKKFSSVREIYAVTPADVLARVDREEKLIDLTIIVRERRRR
jgi:hypothetical protein